jgi:hypothetical protein
MGVTMRRSILALALASLLASPAAAQYPAGPTNQSSLALIAPPPPATDNSNRIATTAWVNLWVASATPLASGKIWIGSVGNIATPQTPSGDLTVSNAGVFTFGTVNANVGAFGSATLCPTVTVNAKGLITAASAATCTPAIGSITGLGAGFATWAATPSSANLRATLTDETGTGLAYFQGGDIGTPSAGVGTNLTGLNATNISTGTLNSARMAYNGAILQATPSAPTGTTSASAVMMGLGVTTCRFTPTFSTRVRFEVNGSVANTTVNGNSTFSLRYGTGAGPANGAVASGASPSSSQTVTSSTTNAQVAFVVSGLVTGLSAGTTYWFDTTLAASAGTSAILSPNCAAYEF